MDNLSNDAIATRWNTLKLNEQGLIPAIVINHESNTVLMMAWMNNESFRLTLETKKATFFSRSRNKIWVKGEDSGNTQELVEIRVDCDKDVLLLKVNNAGPACHTGAETCFDEDLIWKAN